MRTDVACVAVTVHGIPPRKNRRHAHGRGGGVRNSEEYLAWCDALAAALAAASAATMRAGRWHLHVMALWPRRRDLGDVVVPYGDVDAPISAVLDGLQRADVLDDDVRVCRLTASKGFATDDDGPKTIINLTLMEDDDG